MIIKDLPYEIQYENSYILNDLALTGSSKYSEILIDDKEVIETDKVRFSGSIVKDVCCRMAEVYNYATLFPSYFRKPLWNLRKGVIIILDGEMLGYFKLLGARSFLATKTVKDEKGRYPLIKGGLYSLEREVKNHFKERNEKWQINELEQLAVKPLRLFIPSKRLIEQNLKQGYNIDDLDLDERLKKLTQEAKIANERRWYRWLHGFSKI